MPVVFRLEDFNPSSGSLLERLVFNYRLLFLVGCLLISGLFAYHSTQLHLNASFQKVIPEAHPYIKNYLKYKNDLPQLGNIVRIVVENTSGDIFDPTYLEALRKINDAVYLIPGVDRGWIKSLWMAGVRYTEVTEEGYNAGAVMPATYDGSPASITELRNNINKANLAGSLVANNFQSSMIVVPLLEVDPRTGQPLDYRQFSSELERQVRAQENDKIKVHIIGFAKLTGDLIDGVSEVMNYFAFSALVAALLIFLYNRCIRSTLAAMTCSLLAVTWQLGLISLLGYELDPYSVLVPFLVFAIGVSHAAQKMNGIMQDIGRGTHKYVAARYTFRRLFVAGLTALLADAVGFAVLITIDIPVIKDLAVTSSVGVGVLIFTNLLLLPVLLSYIGVSPAAAKRSLASSNNTGTGMSRIGELLEHFTGRRWALRALLVAAALGVVGVLGSLHLQIGDLEAGAPELRPNSRYNLDNAYIAKNYGLSSDQFAVIVKTDADGCSLYENLVEMDRLESELKSVPGVQAVSSLSSSVRMGMSGDFEGNPKWQTILRDPAITSPTSFKLTSTQPGLSNQDCSITPLIAYLSDHRADTVNRVLTVVEQFAASHDRKGLEFLPVAGSAGIEAVTNIVVRQSWWEMQLLVYAAVMLLAYITFRSGRAVIVAVVPLVLTTFLVEALMVALGMGVKVATLPVIALGVGIGIDYALYLLSVQLTAQRAGHSLKEAYHIALRFTGKVVALVGVTLAAGVVIWAWSPIKFQADMGILLTFMFVWNMLGALILIPALSHFLLSDVSPKPDFLTAVQPEKSHHGEVNREKSSLLVKY
ncbi:efflux RND transporter permease subunit [Pseudomonas sp. NFX224]|uniref:efflux RND transporter permease subunit n=1 Tax=Pseudomonas sp. NFX224 TaxID=3402862 RepID=UPI003AFA9309